MPTNNLSKSKVETEGWRGKFMTDIDGNLPEGGIAMQNLTHQGYNLAKDIRVLKIWIDAGLPTQKVLTLGPTDFEPTKPKETIVNAEPPPFQFGGYIPVQSVKAIYISKVPPIDGGSILQITQTYIFTNYTNTPAHEPSGSLAAARVFPLIKFEFLEEEKILDNKKAKTVRVDYRIQYNLDLFLKSSTIVQSFKDSGEGRYPDEEEKKELKKRPQQAGVFRDEDFFIPILNGISPAAITFEATEKPLLTEIASHGLKRGKWIVDSKPITWDNIHWWGGYKKFHIPSTPGAFHAAHLHWRWGLFLQVPVASDNLLKFGPLKNAGDPQFRSYLELGGPLVDFHISDQDIQFAIVKSSFDISDLETNGSDFIKYFKNKQIDPTDIKDGTKIDLLLSTKAYINKIKKFEGTFFIHGLFFAHDKEQGLLSVFSKEEYLPKQPSKPIIWDRLPSDIM